MKTLTKKLAVLTIFCLPLLSGYAVSILQLNAKGNGGRLSTKAINAAKKQVYSKAISVELSNAWNRDKADAPVVLKIDDMQVDFSVQSAVVMNGIEEVPSQLDDLNSDSKADELVFVINMPAHSKKVLNVTLSADKTSRTYPARVFAELLMRDANNQMHIPIQSITAPGTSNIYNQLQHHGPAFESELVAYRVYFNSKQTVDPYGKFKKGLEIEESQFYPNDKQLASGFGDDVLMVGNSCGIGALKGWNGEVATNIEPVALRTERIIAYGPIRTVTDIEVKGWIYKDKELNMTNRYILYAGHRDLRVETFFDKPLKDELFCTGVQNIMGGETLSYSDHKGLVGSWGRHWPVNDTVKYAKETIGIATYIPQKHVKAEVQDKDNFLYTISATGSNSFHYYTMFTSGKETFGYSSPKIWFDYLPQWKEELDNPVAVKIVPKTSF